MAEGELKLVETMAESEVYVTCLVAIRLAESITCFRRLMLTCSADGRSLKRSRRKVNGITLREINTLRALKSLRISRWPLNQKFRKRSETADLHNPAALLACHSKLKLIFDRVASHLTCDPNTSSASAKSQNLHFK